MLTLGEGVDDIPCFLRKFSSLGFIGFLFFFIIVFLIWVINVLMNNRFRL